MSQAPDPGKIVGYSDPSLILRPQASRKATLKLAARMTLAISACGLLLFGGAGLVQLRGEERELRVVAEKEVLLLGRTLQVAFENAMRDKQIEDVAETLDSVTQVDPSVAIFVFDGTGNLVGASRNAQPSPEVVRAATLARGQSEAVIEFAPRGEPYLLRLGLRLREETSPQTSAIVFEKPLIELQRDLKSTRQSILVTTVIFILSVAAVTWFLTRRYVGVPLGRLVTNMKRVRSGDLRVLSTSQIMDEVGETQVEFDRLTVDLEVARQRADQEFAARRRMERGLQDADKLITLGQLSAIMAHEIGSPLQILEGRARALRKHADDPNATRRTADMLVEQTERITRIVEQLLSTTRRRPPNQTRIDMEASLHSVLALLELEATKKQVSFVLKRDGRSDLFADDDQVHQVLLNLLRNALQAAPAGSTVTVCMGGDEETLELSISDAGPGIPESARPHLFEPFFTTKAASGGTGLGLSVVKSIMQEHNGKVEFLLDRPGCVVRITLPRRKD